MIDNTNTKKEIITEILALAKYLKKNQLFNMNRSASSLDQDNKQELIDLHRRMVAVISGDIIKRGAKGEIPELKDLYCEVEEKKEKFREYLTTNRQAIFGDIEKIIHHWLGEDLKLRISDNYIVLGVSGTGTNTHSLDISLYYREKNEWGEEKPSTLEVNQPTFGSWDPRHPDNSDIRRFFEVLAKICDPTGWKNMDVIQNLMDKNWDFVIERYHKYEELEKEFHDKAAVIAGEMVMKNYDEYIK